MLDQFVSYEKTEPKTKQNDKYKSLNAHMIDI